MKFDGFVGGTYESSAARADAQRAVNLYPEILDKESKTRLVLKGTPGLSLFGTLPTAPVRALWSNEPSGVTSVSRVFAAGGSKLYEVDSGGGATLLGDIGTDADHSPVQCFPNGNQLFIVSAGVAYCDNGAGPVACVDEDAEPILARTGTFIDSYFVAAPPGKRFKLCNLLDGTTWDPLDFGVKEGYPDNIMSVLTNHSELWLMGDETTELWRNEGGADFPFQRDPSGFQQEGTVAPWSLINLKGGPGWLGGNTRGRVEAIKAQGFSPVTVSTPAVEAIWSGYSRVSDAISFAYHDNGHTFWQITFPTANATWVYDLTTKFWHERAYWDGAAYQRHRARCHAHAFGKHLVGDHTNGKIYQMSEAFLDDAGQPIRRMRRAPHVSKEEQNIFHHSLQLDMQTGESVADPVMSLSWSNDGGKTWNTPQDKTAGAIADYDKRVIWRRLGKSRDRVYEIASTAAIEHCWIDAYLNATPGHA